MNTPVIPEHAPRAALAIVQRYDGAVNYLYPLLINMSHKHRVLRDSMIAALFEQYRLFYEAAKSNQVSRVYIADAGLAHLKDLLRLRGESNPQAWRQSRRDGRTPPRTGDGTPACEPGPP